MLCPSCGTDNPDESGMCSKCGFKFRFGYAFNDSKKMRFFNLTNFKTRKQKVIGLLLISLSIIILTLVIFAWVRSI